MSRPTEQVTHLLDAGFFGASVIAFALQWTPVITFVTVCATFVWAIYRIIEIRLNIALKRKQLKDKS